MSYKATILKVLIASPSDLNEERKIIPDILSYWNLIHSEDLKVILQPIMWERNSYPHLGEHPQVYWV